MRLLPVVFWGGLRIGLIVEPVTGQEMGNAPPPVQVAEALETAPLPEQPVTGVGEDAWGEIIRAAILTSLPEKSVQDKRWGGTVEVLSRYEIKTRKGKISVRPKTKLANHGLWQRQTLTMLKPDETLKVEFRNVQRVPHGPLTFTMQLVIRARVKAEFVHWVYGVKGLNGQAEADVRIAATTDCSMDLASVQQDGDLLPSVQLVPEIHSLGLKVQDIDARQIGLVGGWAAEEIGDSSRSTVNSLLNEFEGAILKDLRQKIEKHQTRLRVSPSQLLGLSKPQSKSLPAK